ncbi:hypothetical protein TSMEX_009435 [Taenia solium]|eukprot:TsM_001109700 transcript=TsM_001109700 gene=TsM_001109700
MHKSINTQSIEVSSTVSHRSCHSTSHGSILAIAKFLAAAVDVVVVVVAACDGDMEGVHQHKITSAFTEGDIEKCTRIHCERDSHTWGWLEEEVGGEVAEHMVNPHDAHADRMSRVYLKIAASA